MKTIPALLFCLLFIPGCIWGQEDSLKFKVPEIRKADPFPFSDYRFDFKNNKSIDDYMKRIDPSDNNKIFRFKTFPDGSVADSVRIMLPPDFNIAEEFPGSERFYRKFTPDKRGKLIIKKPDTSAKYYLIIQDPVRHTMTR